MFGLSKGDLVFEISGCLGLYEFWFRGFGWQGGVQQCLWFFVAAFGSSFEYLGR